MWRKRIRDYWPAFELDNRVSVFLQTLSTFYELPRMFKVYTDVVGMKKYCHDCPAVREIIHSLKLADYLLIQADKPWNNYQ